LFCAETAVQVSLYRLAQSVELARQGGETVPTGAGLLHHPSLTREKPRRELRLGEPHERCRAEALRAEAGPLLPRNELRPR
jgi:hypothetical protein